MRRCARRMRPPAHAAVRLPPAGPCPPAPGHARLGFGGSNAFTADVISKETSSGTAPEERITAGPCGAGRWSTTGRPSALLRDAKPPPVSHGHCCALWPADGFGGKFTGASSVQNPPPPKGRGMLLLGGGGGHVVL